MTSDELEKKLSAMAAAAKVYSGLLHECANALDVPMLKLKANEFDKDYVGWVPLRARSALKAKIEAEKAPKGAEPGGKFGSPAVAVQE